jgi:hypothetical protein
VPLSFVEFQRTAEATGLLTHTLHDLYLQLLRSLPPRSISCFRRGFGTEVGETWFICRSPLEPMLCDIKGLCVHVTRVVTDQLYPHCNYVITGRQCWCPQLQLVRGFQLPWRCWREKGTSLVQTGDDFTGMRAAPLLKLICIRVEFTRDPWCVGCVTQHSVRFQLLSSLLLQSASMR